MNPGNVPKSASVADALLDFFEQRGLRHVFVVPGMQVDPLVKALAHHARLRPILASHELAAGYMADGYARASGGIGATFAIGGPGCANLVGAAVAAKADRSPVLFVTGNIPRAARGRGEFQDAGPDGANDVATMAAAAGMSLPCEAAGDLRQVLADAARRLDQRLPVHVSVAMDVQLAVATDGVADISQPSLVASDTASLPDKEWLAVGRVLLVVGSEALVAADAVQAAARSFQLAVASDLGARGIVPEDALHSIGHLGFMPHPRAVAALAGDRELRAERVIALGCDESILAFLQSRHGDVQAVAPAMFMAWLQQAPALPEADVLVQRGHWLMRLAAMQRPMARIGNESDRMSYAEVVDTVAASLPHSSRFVVDAGQVRRIAVVRLQCRQPRTLFVAEGMAPMGWSLGAAIGVQLACPQQPVVALLGDGAMCMHGIELATAARYRLPILYVLFDNGAYGSVLARMQGDAEDDTARLPPIDWLAFASALGVEAIKVGDVESLRSALRGAERLSAPRLVIATVPAIEPDAYGEATGIDWGLDGMAQARLDT